MAYSPPHRIERTQQSQAGISLVEIVVTIAITGLVAAMVTTFMIQPFQAYQDISRRALLVDTAETALRRIARDVRAALPNSVRVTAGNRALELIHVEDGTRYRSGAGINPPCTLGTLPCPEDHRAADDWLDFATADAQFNILSPFQNLTFTPGVPISGRRIAIYTTDSATAYNSAASGANVGVITAAGNVTISGDGDEDKITLAVPHRFSFASPRQRLYVVDTPVSYLCDLGAGTLTRYRSYAYATAQPSNPAAAPLSGATAGLLARNVTACTFTYFPGTPTRAGLLSAALELSAGDERVRLLHQVHVENTP